MAQTKILIAQIAAAKQEIIAATKSAEDAASNLQKHVAANKLKKGKLGPQVGEKLKKKVQDTQESQKLTKEKLNQLQRNLEALKKQASPDSSIQQDNEKDEALKRQQAADAEQQKQQKQENDLVDALDDAQKQWVKLATVWIPNVNTKEVNRLRVAGTLLMMFVADIDTNTDINTNTEQNDEVDLVSDANIIHSSTAITDVASALQKSSVASTLEAIRKSALTHLTTSKNVTDRVTQSLLASIRMSDTQASFLKSYKFPNSSTSEDTTTLRTKLTELLTDAQSKAMGVAMCSTKLQAKIQLDKLKKTFDSATASFKEALKQAKIEFPDDYEWGTITDVNKGDDNSTFLYFVQLQNNASKKGITMISKAIISLKKELGDNMDKAKFPLAAEQTKMINSCRASLNDTRRLFWAFKLAEHFLAQQGDSATFSTKPDSLSQTKTPALVKYIRDHISQVKPKQLNDPLDYVWILLAKPMDADGDAESDKNDKDADADGDKDGKTRQQFQKLLTETKKAWPEKEDEMVTLSTETTWRSTAEKLPLLPFLIMSKQLLEDLTSYKGDMKGIRISSKFFPIVANNIVTTFGLPSTDIDRETRLWFEQRNFATWYNLYMNEYFEPLKTKLALGGGKYFSRPNPRLGRPRLGRPRLAEHRLAEHRLAEEQSRGQLFRHAVHLQSDRESKQALTDAVRLYAACLFKSLPGISVPDAAAFMLRQPEQLVRKLVRQVKLLRSQYGQSNRDGPREKTHNGPRDTRQPGAPRTSFDDLVGRVTHACDVLVHANAKANAKANANANAKANANANANANAMLTRFVQAEVQRVATAFGHGI